MATSCWRAACGGCDALGGGRSAGCGTAAGDGGLPGGCGMAVGPAKAVPEEAAAMAAIALRAVHPRGLLTSRALRTVLPPRTAHTAPDAGDRPSLPLKRALRGG